MTLRFLTAGESHGAGLTAILEGAPAGLEMNADLINRELARRQAGYGSGPRMKLEHDQARILGGVMEGKTTGAPLALFIENQDHVRWRGKPIPSFTIPRPGHADLTGVIKYNYNDLRPALERSSARETAARVAVGAVCKQILATFGIQVGGYVTAIGAVVANLSEIPVEKRAEQAEASDVRCPDPAASESIRAAIRQVMLDRDTLGGVIEVVALGLPPGLGSFVHWDRRLEARLGAAVLSVPAVRGVEVGPAFENAGLSGTQANDPIRLEGSNLVRPGLRSGGVEGGVTTGQPLLIRAAMKPIPTTLIPQPSVDLANGQEVETHYERSDFCPVPRAVPVLEAMIAFVLADALLEKLGGDSISELLPRYESLRRARIEDLLLEGQNHIFWPE